MLKLYLFALFLGFASQINCESQPVLIWGHKTPTYFPTLKHLDGDEFITLVQSQADKDTLTVVFVENNLSVEDLSQCKLKTKTCFENLRSIQDKTYLSSVENPVDSLIASHGKKKTVTLSSEDDLKEAHVNGEKILIVHFDDAEDAEDFHRHDELMKAFFDAIQESHSNVVAIYTGRHPSFKYTKPLIRKPRDAEPDAAEEKKADEEPKPAQEPPTATTQKAVIKPKQEEVDERPVQKVWNAQKHSIVALGEFWFQQGETEPVQVPIEGMTVTEVVATVETDEVPHVNVTLASGTHRLFLSMAASSGSWHVGEIKYNDNTGDEQYLARTSIGAPNHYFSFGCSDLTIDSTRRTNTITLKYFQIQPFFSKSQNVTTAFSGYNSDCVGYFSPAIWSALFVVILFLFILFYGLMSIMDIRTMDKFDDPKGKTITINAQD